MKKYVIQDVDDKQYYASNNEWCSDVDTALMFEKIEEAWTKAVELNKECNYTLSVIPIIH